MRSRTLAFLFLLASLGSAAALVEQPVYVDTQGGLVAERGNLCLPEEKLSDGTVRVYNKTPTDMALLDRRMQDAGVAEQERARIILAADSNECARKSARECSKGTCTSGTCKQKSTGNFTSCSCQ